MTIKTTISPSIHEGMISRHFKEDEDDAVLKELHDAVRITREMATKSAATSAAVLKNTLKTEAARHREARAATFGLIERATQALDAALAGASKEVADLREKLRGPSASKDPVLEARQKELRERLAMLPDERRKAIIAEAVRSDDDLLVGAVLSQPYWVSGLGSASEIELVRGNWQTRRYGAELDRLQRLGKAIADAQRAGSLAIKFVDELTDAGMIADAEKSEKAANAALAEAKVG